MEVTEEPDGTACYEVGGKVAGYARRHGRAGWLAMACTGKSDVFATAFVAAEFIGHEWARAQDITLPVEAIKCATGSGSFRDADDLLEVVRRADERGFAVASHTERRHVIEALRQDEPQGNPAPLPYGPPRLRIVR